MNKPTIQETEARRREMAAQNEINSLRAKALPRGSGSRSATGSGAEGQTLDRPTAADKLERARVTLQVIYTWAKFRDGEAFHRLDVLRLVEKTLREMK